jgi:arginine/serine-rich splicing factor 12
MTGSSSSNSSNNDIYAVSTRFNFKGRHVTLIIDTLFQDKIVQVTNVAPQANKEQMQTLFGIIGKIEDLRLYPTLYVGLHVWQVFHN